MKHDNKKDPPAEIKGNGNPFTGNKPTVIAELINICNKRIEAIPTMTRLEK